MSLSKSSIISQQNLTASNLENDCVYEFEDFRLDAAHLMLYKAGKTVSLKPKTIETLVALVERGGEVIGKDELMNRLWADSFVEESNLTQNIYLLRKTLGNCADGEPYIENFARRGYRFNGKVKAQNDAKLLIASHTKTQTIIEEVTIEPRANPTRRNLFLTILGLAAVFAAAALAFRNYVAVPNHTEAQNSAALSEPFRAFNLKRHSETGDITSAKISPDGKLIAYTDKKNAMWLKNTVTGGRVKILQEAETSANGVGAISPDNNYIYLTHSTKEKKNEVLKMSLFGDGIRQKIADDNETDLALSPDGRYLSFVRYNTETGKFALIVANADGSGERNTAFSREGTWFGTWSQSVAWSPDGSQIACAGGMIVDGKSVLTIKIFRAADGREVSLIRGESNFRWISSVVWLPDADNLLVISGDQSSIGQIYKYTISSGIWRRVTNDLSDYVQLSVPTDGKTVVSTQEENPGNLWILPADGDAKQAKQITFGRNLMTDNTGVSWTPDGKIVYATNAGGNWEIWQIEADGADLKQLTSNCAGNDSCSQPFASPDGRYIVFQAKRDGINNIWRMNAGGTNAIQLTFEGGISPSFSPDGQIVIYLRWTSPAATLWQVPVEGGESRQYSKISTAGDAAFSPDGRQMAFHYYDIKAKSQTCVAAVGADAPEKCFAISRSFPRWAANGKAFYYLDHGYAGIWKQPLDGERELFLAFTGERTNNFAFSHDGKQLVVARSRPTKDIVVLIDEY